MHQILRFLQVRKCQFLNRFKLKLPTLEIIRIQILIYDTCLDQCEDPPCGPHCYCPRCRPNVQGSRPSGDNRKPYVSFKPGSHFQPDNFGGNPKIPGSKPGDGSINSRPGGTFGSNPGSYPGSGNYPRNGKREKYQPDGIYLLVLVPFKYTPFPAKVLKIKKILPNKLNFCWRNYSREETIWENTVPIPYMTRKGFSVLFQINMH